MRLQIIGGAVIAALAVSGCSTVMEAQRPQGVQLAKYHLGEKRMDVISTLGAPESSVKDNDNSCDVYSVYTSRTNGAQKAAVILGEGAADLFTAGLFEIVATPAQAVTKPKKHTVLVCYGPGDAGLVAVKDEGQPVVGEGAQQAQPPQPGSGSTGQISAHNQNAP